jgi:hypothetical protein
MSAQSRASSQATYYSHHGEGQYAVPKQDETLAMENTYSFVSPSEAASARAEESDAEGSVASGKRFRFPKIKLSLTAKPKPKKRPTTPRSAVRLTSFPSSFIPG